jgi:hypothetical protein
MKVEMKIDVKVDTFVNGNLIVQDVSSVVGDKISQVSRQVCDTSEKGIRDALVKMGWMPPDVADEVLDVLETCERILKIEGCTYTAGMARKVIDKVEKQR